MSPRQNSATSMTALTPPPKILIVLTYIALSISVTTALDYPQYSFYDHPFFTDSQFRNIEKRPGIVRKYYRFSNGRHTTSDVIFTPQNASYVQFPSLEPFAEKVDALFVTPSGRKNWQERNYLQVVLNARARVFLLLTGRGIDLKALESFSWQGSDEWSGLRALQSSTGNRLPLPLSGGRREQKFYPARGAAVEMLLEADTLLSLPHPRMMKVNGKQVHSYVLLFAQEDPIGKTPARAFPYQQQPVSLIKRQTGEKIEPDSPVPNETCPEWVHDLYLTESRDGDVAKNQQELPYWRTWHPQIDPMFWCYFTHEHGSYPGVYRPALGYTAWKTLDEKSVHKRQEESNEGFKVFAIPLRDQSKYLMLVMHMHVSQPRRFHTRHHTAIVAILDDKWELEMELHFKMDFGFAFGTMNKTFKKRQLPFPGQNAIRAELISRKRLAGRRFNVLNIDENYPESVNNSFAFTCNIKPTANNKQRILTGIYEQWFGPLNTCSSSEHRVDRGLKVDIRDPSTAKRTASGEVNEPVQQLRGSGVNRKVVIPKGGVWIRKKDCQFVVDGGVVGDVETKDGVFYTDAYLREVHHGPGANSLRQFIGDGFEGIWLKQGQITPVDGWGGHMGYDDDEKARRRFWNVEGGVLGEYN